MKNVNLLVRADGEEYVSFAAGGHTIYSSRS